jgi:hypothetical protein
MLKNIGLLKNPANINIHFIKKHDYEKILL